jgi:hypothetical protein
MCNDKIYCVFNSEDTGHSTEDCHATKEDKEIMEGKRLARAHPKQAANNNPHLLATLHTPLPRGVPPTSNINKTTNLSPSTKKGYNSHHHLNNPPKHLPLPHLRKKKA